MFLDLNFLSVIEEIGSTFDNGNSITRIKKRKN